MIELNMTCGGLLLSVWVCTALKNRLELLLTRLSVKGSSAGNFSCGSNPCFIPCLRRDDDEIIDGVGDIVDDDIMLRRVIWTY
jgi:hypothetical protein